MRRKFRFEVDDPGSVLAILSPVGYRFPYFADLHRVNGKIDNRIKISDGNFCASLVVGEKSSLSLGHLVVGVLPCRRLELDRSLLYLLAQAVEERPCNLNVGPGRRRCDQDMPLIVLISAAVDELHDMKTKRRLERL